MAKKAQQYQYNIVKEMKTMKMKWRGGGWHREMTAWLISNGVMAKIEENENGEESENIEKESNNNGESENA
jgi:hypothetical protein